MLQTDFLALYRGQTVAEARLVAITAQREIVTRFIRELAGEAEGAEEQREPLRLVERGRSSELWRQVVYSGCCCVRW